MSEVLTANLLDVNTRRGVSIALEIDQASSIGQVVEAACSLANEHCRIDVKEGARLIFIVNATGGIGTGVAWQATVALQDATADILAESWCAILRELIGIALKPPPLAGTPGPNAPTTETPQ